MEVGVDAFDYLVVQCPDDFEEKPPHVEQLPEPLSVGSCISIRGFIRPECTRFAINLKCEKSDDIAFHINPRISQRYIVRNCRVNGKWAEEETASMSKFELIRNKKFQIDIVVSDMGFLVSVNGKHTCGFAFRLPISKISTLYVEGHVDVEDVQYKKLQIYPQPSSLNVPYIVPTGDGQDKDTLQQLTVSCSDIDSGNDEIPVTAVLPKGFEKHWQLEISGRVKILPSAFYINLQHGSQLWPHPVVPLHLNPRFHNSSVVRNTWTDGKWGKEECSATFPFSPGKNFNIIVRKNDDHFAVWVDDQLCGEFKFRGDVDVIDTVYIHGDVIVKTLYMRDHIDDKYFRQSEESLQHLSL